MAIARPLQRMMQMLSYRRRAGREIARQADRLRDQRQYSAAALLYEEALRYLPAHAGYHVQCGNMLKDGGAPEGAEAHYKTAAELSPDDADVFMQLGHLYKKWGRRDESIASYRRALELKPGWIDAKEELDRLSTVPEPDSLPSAIFDTLPNVDVEQEAELLAVAGSAPLLPDLLPRPRRDLMHPHSEGLELRGFGRSERTAWGTRKTLRGVEVIRGFCISLVPIVDIQILLNGRAIYRAPPSGGFPLSHERDRPELRKFPFNAWVDLSSFTRGPHEVLIRAINARQQVHTLSENIIIETAFEEEDHPSSNGIVSLDPDDTRSVEEQINSRPTVVRTGRRSLFHEPPKTILVQRPDQLGDMVVSVPAIRRIRELFPEARLIGLLSNGNVDLARSLDLFDEIVVTNFSEDRFERRRNMPLAEQKELARELQKYVIDLAIDLSENAWSRRLLLLSNAPFLYGFRAGSDMPALTVDIEGNTHDAWNGHEVVPHTNKLLGLVEWLGAMARSDTNIVRRTAPSAAALAEIGLSEGDRVAVLHDGARLQFSRWPYYAELAKDLLGRPDMHVIWITDDTGKRDSLPYDLVASSRFQLIERRLSFDVFDALVANCALFVGNDSGPKHLASLRGAPIVSIHCARNNWNEWGQENGGLILSRKMPCAGCLVHYDPEECGRDFACIRDIKPQEVFDACTNLLAAPQAAEAIPASAGTSR